MPSKKPPAPSKSSRGANKTATNTSRPTSSKPPKSSSQDTPAQKAEKSDDEEETRRQQTLLDIFSTTFREVLDAEDFAAQLQEVKAALFNRDFEGAFAREAALDVYAARWSPTRALCYGRVLRGLDSHLQGLLSDSPEAGASVGVGVQRRDDERGAEISLARDESAALGDGTRDAEPETQEKPAETTERGDAERGENTKILKILAIGGAAAEIVAFADYISTQNTRAEITLLDIGPWATIVHKLQTALTTAPPLSRYASAHARLANKALVAPSHLHSTFVQTDILSLAPSELAQFLAVPENESSGNSTPVLVTLLFTLNELYTTSGTQRTTAFLRVLAARAAPGTLLLVVDSPGSYAEAAVGRDARRYPMQWLLEHTLLLEAPARRKASREDSNNNTTKNGKLEDRGPGSGAQQQKTSWEKTSWEKVESHDSVWFRVAEGLRYPIPLENMRYQMHLYRARRADEGPGSPAT
ncbi:hypothetical protein F4825DRAFT_430505 [Nemania diffusa]|nr:hypothetical protein F4825DRAFT_430505 [Nemania diffusa]